MNLKTKGCSQISERDFLGQVIDLAHIFGWKVAHFRPAKTEHGWRTAVQADGAGFPDLVLVHQQKRRLIFAELKSEDGKTTLEQEEWLKDLEQCQKPLLLEPLKLKEGKASVVLKVGQKILTIPEVYIFRPSDVERITEILR